MFKKRKPKHDNKIEKSANLALASNLPSTLGELRESGWQSKSVKEEIAQNLIRRIQNNKNNQNNKETFEGIWGFEDSVFPALENAILAKHDIIFLGERGQAKSRLTRKLLDLLDPKIPIIAGSEINDDPYNPVSKYAKELFASKGDQMPITWIGCEERFGEKLATPDTSIADLIGEVDPIKVAEGRYLSDELTLHYGLIPRVNRGIFAINELPDLAERIQVGLLNILEERDVQIRGYKISLPLDILLVASANPEDYTNRGHLITPLKDRFGSQIRTHYPQEIETERKIVKQEATSISSSDFEVTVPEFMLDILVVLSQELRNSGSVDQGSGVSVRLSVSNYEALMASSVRRILKSGETKAVPRICDLDAIISSMSGKVEFDTMESSSDLELFSFHIKSAILTAFENHFNVGDLQFLLDAFDGSLEVSTGDGVPTQQYKEALTKVTEFNEALKQLGLSDQDLQNEALVASGIEFILEGLHLSNCLNKHTQEGKVTYEATEEARHKLEA